MKPTAFRIERLLAKVEAEVVPPPRAQSSPPPRRVQVINDRTGQCGTSSARDTTRGSVMPVAAAWQRMRQHIT